MPKKKKAPELTFQQHVEDYLVREHTYGVLEQTEITDREHCIAEDHLWAFLKATQARDEVFKALRKELGHTPLWMLMRHGLKVRGWSSGSSTPSPAPPPAPLLRNMIRTA
jgi:type I restriction enzyme R subunit